MRYSSAEKMQHKRQMNLEREKDLKPENVWKSLI